MDKTVKWQRRTNGSNSNNSVKIDYLVQELLLFNLNQEILIKLKIEQVMPIKLNLLIKILILILIIVLIIIIVFKLLTKMIILNQSIQIAAVEEEDRESKYHIK